MLTFRSARSSSRILLVLLIGVGGVASGCEVGFEPFVGNERHYSVSGYLDVEADTQYVRVERLRDSLLLGTKPIEATVTLEHLGSGQTWSLRDSIFSLGQGKQVHNFWTTAPMRPLETYRVSVRDSGGAKTQTTVTLPDTFPDPEPVLYPPCLFPDPFECPDKIKVNIKNVDKLAALNVVSHYDPTSRTNHECGASTSIRYLEEAERTEDGFLLVVDWMEDVSRVNSLLLEEDVSAFMDVELSVAAGGPEWPDREEVLGMDEESLFLPGNTPAVDGGVGFVGGVATKTTDVFPAGDCDGAGGARLSPAIGRRRDVETSPLSAPSSRPRRRGRARSTWGQ